jgi:hypothetical protein
MASPCTEGSSRLSSLETFLEARCKRECPAEIGDKYYPLKEASETAQGTQLRHFEKRDRENDDDTCCERPTCQWAPLRILPESTIEDETLKGMRVNPIAPRI